MRNARNLKTWFVVSLFPAVLGVPSFAAGRTIYVDVDASGANDGSTWQNTYNHLQDALADIIPRKSPSK